MDSVDTHKNEAQERTPKINFVQRFFRKLIGYQELDNTLKNISKSYAHFEKTMERKYANYEPEIDYNQLSYDIDYGNLSEYVDTYDVATQMDSNDVADYINLDYEDLALNIDYARLYNNLLISFKQTVRQDFLDEDMKDAIESVEKELLTIQNNLDGFYQTLSKMLKERNL